MDSEIHNFSLKDGSGMNLVLVNGRVMQGADGTRYLLIETFGEHRWRFSGGSAEALESAALLARAMLQSGSIYLNPHIKEQTVLHPRVRVLPPNRWSLLVAMQFLASRFPPAAKKNQSYLCAIRVPALGIPPLYLGLYRLDNVATDKSSLLSLSHALPSPYRRFAHFTGDNARRLLDELIASARLALTKE